MINTELYFKNLKNQNVNVPVDKYKINWDDDSLSKFQWEVKQFLRKYWEAHIVYEELLLGGTRGLRLDFFNLTKRVGIECQGMQHVKYNKFFHNASLSQFRMQMERDVKKANWCEINDITLVEIFEHDVDDLSRKWFKDKYNINL